MLFAAVEPDLLVRERSYNRLARCQAIGEARVIGVSPGNVEADAIAQR
jgi:hypothetical protein